MNERTRLYVSTFPELKQEIRAICRMKDISISKLVNSILEEYISPYRNKIDAFQDFVKDL